MQVIGLIGSIDKSDYVINLAKVLRISSKTVLVIDATSDKKYKYIIPTLNIEDEEYVTQYDRIDFAVGFESMSAVENYMAAQKINIGLYDYIILDIDSSKGYEYFRSRGVDKQYFFMDTSILCLHKSKEIVKTMKVYNTEELKLKLTRVFYRAYLTRTAEKYFENKIEELDVEWNENSYEIPEYEQDKMVNIDSQISGMIMLKKHSREYIRTLAEMTTEILSEVSSKEVLNLIKRGKN